MMTVVATLKLQGRNVLDYLVRANEAALFGHPAASLPRGSRYRSRPRNKYQ
jgi:hypothetical protein